MKIIFMGTPDFSVGTLEALVQAGHDVCLCVTQPDRPKGRGKHVQPSPVKEAAQSYGIPVYQPVKVREEQCVSYLDSFQADVIVVIAFGQILPQSILDLTPYGCINVHASLLPKYRGAAPIQWAIIDGESSTGVTTMQMDAGLDTGDMLLECIVPIDDTETGASLHDKLAKAGADLCVETLRRIETGDIVRRPQPKESPTAYAKMLTKEMGNIDWNRKAEEIDRLVRGLSPWPGAYTFVGSQMLKVWEGTVYKGDDELSSFAPGQIVRAKDDGIIVRAGEGAFRLVQVQLAGKKRMDAGSFLRGFPVEPGTFLKEV